MGTSACSALPTPLDSSCTATISMTTATTPTSSLYPLIGGLSVVLAVLALATQRRRVVHDTSGEAGTKCPVKPRKLRTLDSGIPILGDLLVFSRESHRKHDFMTDVMLRHGGEPWQAHIIGMPTFVNFADPRAIEEITTTQFDNFEKGAFQRDLVGDLLGNGIIVSDGERWYHQRKTAAKFFSAWTLRECMQHTMERNMSEMYAAIEARRSAGEIVDLSQLFQQFTFQTFAEVGLSVKIPLIGEREPNPFERALDTAMSTVLRRARLPPFVWKLERWLGIGEEKVLADAMKTVRQWLQETIEQSLETIRARQQDNQTNVRGQSIIELFVQHSGEDTTGLKPEDISDFILNFLMAARDTSAHTLSWLFYALGKYPEIAVSIRREMARRVAPGTQFLTADDVKNLTYFEATIKETLRLYPAAPNTIRQVVRDTVVCGDIFLRKGMMVGISAWAQARNPRVWGPDAAKFNPQRWIDATTGELVQVPAAQFVTFGAGPRSCVGMKLAMLNLRVVAANLLYRYAFEIDPANDGSYLNSPTLAMKHPVLATATRLSAEYM